jgi:hypothetical protein
MSGMFVMARMLAATSVVMMGGSIHVRVIMRSMAGMFSVHFHELRLLMMLPNFGCKFLFLQ